VSIPVDRAPLFLLCIPREIHPRGTGYRVFPVTVIMKENPKIYLDL
jgi:hypothetical protein